MKNDAHDYCQELINKFDHDHYLTTLYAGPQKRPSLFALYAFNYEISRIGRIVSEPMVGEIRLHWWREAIAGIFADRVGSHEIMPSLATAILDHKLPRERLMAMIDGRVAALYRDRGEVGGDLEDYLTEGNLACLAVNILGQRDIADLADKLGIAWGYVTVMLSAPVSRPGIFSRDHPENMRSLARQFCRHARRHLDDIAEDKNRLAPESRSVFLLSSLARSYLKMIEKADYNVFELQIEAGALMRQWRLFMAAVFKRI